MASVRNAEMKYSAASEKSLFTEIWDPALACDLYKYVMFTWPWGKRDTPLEGQKGPRTWQIEDLEEITDAIRNNKGLLSLDLLPESYSKTTVSGRGPGKSALVAWLIHWMMSCNVGSSSIVTANTEEQLKTKTWAELGKWHTMAINGHWFERTALSYFPAKWYETAVKDQLKIDTGYYYAKALLWSEENPDAFAGAHNPHGMALFMDEASGIPNPIWAVSEGFFTDPILHRYWLVYSNGRRNRGAFYDTHKGRTPWARRRQLDSRTVEGIDSNVLQGIIDKYGADSDEARVEVYGEFPDASEDQFIAHSLINDAAYRVTAPDAGAPLIMGVDVARSGRASSVARFRQGRDARTIPPHRWHGLTTIPLAHKLAELIDYYNPDAVNIDAGNGTGVIDYLRDVLKYTVNEVWFGSKVIKDTKRWGNKRIEMYDDVRAWLAGGCIDDYPKLKTDLAALRRYQPKNTDLWYLESKQDMRDRGVEPTDDGDALACTFAFNVSRQDRKTSKRRIRQARDVDYAILG